MRSGRSLRNWTRRLQSESCPLLIRILFALVLQLTPHRAAETASGAGEPEAAMRELLVSAMPFLPKRDVQRAQSTVDAAVRRAASGRAKVRPREKFSFRSRRKRAAKKAQDIKKIESGVASTAAAAAMAAAEEAGRSFGGLTNLFMIIYV